MTKHANRLTDAVSAAISRRGFLGRISRIAGGLSAGAAAVLAATKLNAAPSNKTILCCVYITPDLNYLYVCKHHNCPETYHKYQLLGHGEVSSCDECAGY